MNNRLKFYTKNLRLFYYTFRYSTYFSLTISFGIIVSCILLSWVFILPMIQSWFSIQAEVKSTQDRIRVIQQNTHYLRNTDSSVIDKNFFLASQALPAEKDFIGIMAAFGRAAAVNNVSLKDYTFGLGEIKKKDPTDTSMPVKILLNVEGDIGSINNFVKTLEKTVPIIQVESINFSEAQGDLMVTFYIQPLSNIAIKDYESIDILTLKDKKLLSEIEGWTTGNH